MTKFDKIFAIACLIVCAAFIGWMIYESIGSNKRANIRIALMERKLDLKERKLDLKENGFAKPEKVTEKKEESND